ncbi:ATP-grasp fold amidoligase family protein [Marinagarivorans algicola]|uniref:ATP-grasp fold amidoligase family protein n=1 Tax=Marinagarivorans algicola TaxID=1513270 RepID=UPI0037350375
MLIIYKYREIIQNFLKLSFLSEKKIISHKFKKKLGYTLNIDQPKTFNEKIQYRKLYERNPLFITCADKYAVREYVTQKIGNHYLIPLIQVIDSVDTINFASLPEQFVVKATHGSGWNMIVKDKSKIDFPAMQYQLGKWLLKNFYPRQLEWHYKNIKPQLVFEEMILDASGNIPTDFKFHVFNKKNETEIYIQVDSDRFGAHTRDYFTTSWEKLKLAVKCPNSNEEPQKPKNLEEMIEVARKLSEDFNYVRVDLYSVDNAIYFGELTFSPEAGFSKFSPAEADRQWGESFILQQ